MGGARRLPANHLARGAGELGLVPRRGRRGRALAQCTAHELINLVRCLQRLFPLGQAMETDINDLARPASVVAACVFVNVGVDPLQQHTRAGKHLATSRTDALSYSGLGENLALTFDLVMVTS